MRERGHASGVLLVVTAAAVLGMAVMGAAWALNYRLFYRMVYGGPPQVPCADLPVPEAVQVTLEMHQEVVEAIEALNPEHVSVRMGSRRCPGRADIVITYATVRDRRVIQGLIGHDSLFFGVPYVLVNI